MPRLVLDDREQRALRGLMAAEPCPGSPLPSREVLELLDVMVPCDSVGAVYQDGTYALTAAAFLGDLQRPHLGRLPPP